MYAPNQMLIIRQKNGNYTYSNFNQGEINNTNIQKFFLLAGESTLQKLYKDGSNECAKKEALYVKYLEANSIFINDEQTTLKNPLICYEKLPKSIIKELTQKEDL